MDNELHAISDQNFKAAFRTVNDEPEHKNYTAMQLRRLVSYGIHARIGNIDVLTLAKEAADEIDRLVELVWAESKRANKAEDKAWHSDERIATLEARVQEETKRAEIAEAKLAVELRKREVEIKLTNPKVVTPNEIMAWVYKKMQEEKNNG